MPVGAVNFPMNPKLDISGIAAPANPGIANAANGNGVWDAEPPCPVEALVALFGALVTLDPAAALSCAQSAGFMARFKFSSHALSMPWNCSVEAVGLLAVDCLEAAIP